MANKKRGPKPGVEKQEAFRLFVIEGMSYAAAGRALGVSRQRVQQLVRPDAATFDLVRERANSMCESCQLLLGTGEGHIHHKKKTCTQLETFNNPKNLMYLCRSCHRNAHVKMDWDAWWKKNKCRRSPVPVFTPRRTK